MKNLNPMELAAGMTDEIVDVIAKYEDAVLLPTVLGILDVIKFDLIRDHMAFVEDDEDDEDDE
jgi:hypothetical protein